MNVVLKKICNRTNDYIIIFNSIQLPLNIIICLTLNSKGLRRLSSIIDMLQKNYHIADMSINFDSNDIYLNDILDSIFDFCIF